MCRNTEDTADADQQFAWHRRALERFGERKHKILRCRGNMFLVLNDAPKHLVIDVVERKFLGAEPYKALLRHSLACWASAWPLF